jgi:hypothetical protein
MKRAMGENGDAGVVTQEMIARRAFEIWLTNDSATPEENWARAEQELRQEAAEREAARPDDRR